MWDVILEENKLKLLYIYNSSILSDQNTRKTKSYMFICEEKWYCKFHIQTYLEWTCVYTQCKYIIIAIPNVNTRLIAACYAAT